MDRPELPEDREQLAAFSDFSSYHMTVERAEDGTIYLVSWAWGANSVIFALRPDGTIWKDD